MSDSHKDPKLMYISLPGGLTISAMLNEGAVGRDTEDNRRWKSLDVSLVHADGSNEILCSVDYEDEKGLRTMVYAGEQDDPVYVHYHGMGDSTQKINFSQETTYVPKATYFRTEDMITEVENLNKNTPDGVIVDADTILADILENCDYEVSGIAQDIFNIWKCSLDKKAVEQMFYAFTDMEFDRYLMKCKEEVTQNHQPEQKPFDFDGANVYVDQTGALMCQLEGEEVHRFVRSRIQDIRDGDVFLAGSQLLTAYKNASQDIDAKSCPWSVMDCRGNIYFEEDIRDAKRFFMTVSSEKTPVSKEQKMSLKDQILSASTRQLHNHQISLPRIKGNSFEL